MSIYAACILWYLGIFFVRSMFIKRTPYCPTLPAPRLFQMRFPNSHINQHHRHH